MVRQSNCQGCCYAEVQLRKPNECQWILLPPRSLRGFEDLHCCALSGEGREDQLGSETRGRADASLL